MGTWQATPGAPVASITLAPQSATIIPDDQLQLKAVTRRAAGDRLFVRPVALSSDAPGVVTVSPEGLVSGVAPGTANVSATVDGKTATVAVTVDALHLPSPLAFESDRDGYFHIFLMQTNGHVVRLTTTSGNDAEPSWAPDGTKIAFASDRDGHYQIYVMNADGTGQTRLTTSSGTDVERAWSPDGTKIAFTSGRDGPYQIYVMNADGTNVVRLTTGGYNTSEPAWSPDGTKIAFASWDARWAMQADGTNVVSVTPILATCISLCNYYHPGWSPDGTKMLLSISVYAADYLGIFSYQPPDLYVMNPDGTGVKPITGNLAADDYGRWKP